MSADALFAFEDVVLDIDDRRVLDHVSLDIGAGGVTVIVGPSGSGKSTLLRLCNRLEVPGAGTVRYRGEDVGGLDPLALRRRVGMVFQRPTPFPGTVAANLRVASPDAGEDAMVDALERAGLDRSFLDRPAMELSGGEAQRVCLARTLVTGPEVVLLDEPTSALDPIVAKDLERSLRSLVDDGVPMLWVSHDLGQAERVGDALVALVDGRVADGHVREHFLRGERGDHVHGDAPEER